jgi:4-hydroxybenzoate polyprenyltransferase
VSAPARGFLAKTAVTLEMIKVAHTIFALPFALAALLIAARAAPPAGAPSSRLSARLVLLVVLAMVLARAAAMAFNRLVDADFDARNPRTSGRALPAGRLTRRFAGGFAAACALLFVGCAALINPLCFWLSPVALAVVLGYSYAKRFTVLSHLWLGVSLAIAPLAAWISVTGVVDATTWIPGLLAVAVLFWVAGFDLIYACQDYEFDRREGLHSWPARLGPRGALLLARAFHLVTILGLVACGLVARRGAAWWVAVALAGLLLVWQHRIADPREPRRLEIAFFRLNAAIGPLLLLAVAVEEWLR